MINQSLNNEVIVVRSLTDSDLGLFAAHRPTTPSKQRAININAKIAQQLLAPDIFEKEEVQIECRIVFNNIVHDSPRHFGKVGKNWRLGGNKIEGDEFFNLDSRDFALIRSIENNDGSHRMTTVFISRASQPFHHARIVRLVEPTMKDSMEIYKSGSAGFDQLSILFPLVEKTDEDNSQDEEKVKDTGKKKERRKIPPMPRTNFQAVRARSIEEKLKSPHLLEQMLKASSDLSAPAQLSFIDTVGAVATQLRAALLISNRIIKIERNHTKAWQTVKGQVIGFVDGGLANLSMIGSSPIAARVGGYVVIPGDKSTQREEFIILKKLINELYSSENGGVYDGSFPDISALRDAARISIETAGAVNLLSAYPSLKYLFVHGALVNPVSRYTDIMRDGSPKFSFPNFSQEALKYLVADGSLKMTGRDANFINTYLVQLQQLQESHTSVCGVIEREATTSSAIRSLLNDLDNDVIAPVLPMPSEHWKQWVRSTIDPADEDDALGQRITDSLLFRCLLEPGETISPVKINRNELRRAPEAWKDVIRLYPEVYVSYLQPTEFSSPIRLEIFEKDLKTFPETAELILHCSLLLPAYAFPAGLDIVDKFARIPNWMSKPVNTNTAVQALKTALYKGDERLFNNLRRILCGSSREWLLRPGIYK